MLNIKWYVTLHFVMFIYLSVWFIVPFYVCCNPFLNADVNVEVDVHQIKNCLALESKLFLIQEYDMDEWLTKKSIGYQIFWFILKTV